MFTPEWRERVRSEILELAKNDLRISGGAVTGSATLNKLDAWSDIDLAFGLRDPGMLSEVLSAYTEKMYGSYGALHHLDVWSGNWVYRVFFLSNTLQVDLAFVGQEEFGARASTYQLIFGHDKTLPFVSPAPTESYVGWCWLYALHVRSSLQRNRPWQAEYFLNAFRGQLISLLCRRHKLPEKEGRGVDQLPRSELAGLEPTLAKSTELSELWRAFACLVDSCLQEIDLVDPPLATRIGPTMRELAAP